MALILRGNGAVEGLTDLPNNVITNADLPAGSVIQTVTAHKTDTFSTLATSSSMAAIPGMSVTITPTSVSSKILILLGCNMGSSADCLVSYQLYRDSTAIAIGDASGVKPRVTGTAVYASGDDMFYGGIPLNIHYLDSPATTSAITYSLRVGQNNNYTVYFNRIGSDRDTTNYDTRSASSITVMEIAG
jgi:hypothetical protein